MALFRLASLLSCLMIPASLAAQQSPQRDPQAVAVLTQALSVVGGSAAIGSIRDFVATGSITYYWAGQEIQGTLQIRQAGLGNLRLDANLPSGVRSWSVHRGVALLRDTDATTKSISYLSATALGDWGLPFLQILTALHDTSITIAYIGLTSANATIAHQVRVKGNLGTASKSNLASLGTRDFFIDASTLRLLSIQDAAYPMDGRADAYQHTIQFSDYRQVGPILVPFTTMEAIAGQTTCKIQLTSLTLNPGLSDSDFQL